MKPLSYIICSFVILVTFSFCSKKVKTETETNTGDSFNSIDTLSADTINPKLQEYTTFINQLDSSDATSVPKALEKFKEVFNEQTYSLCDSGFVIFQTKYDTIELKLNEKLQKDTTNYAPLFEGDNVPQTLKDFSNKLKMNGFKLSWMDGMAYVEEDRIYITKYFYPYLSETMKAYLTEINIENAEGFAANGGISISPEKLVNRIIWYEKFIYENPSFLYIGKCKNYRKAYLSYLMSGYENTSIYKNRESGELSDYFVKTCVYLLSKYPGAETTRLVKPYYDALKQKQTATADQLYKSYVIKGLVMNVKRN